MIMSKQNAKYKFAKQVLSHSAFRRKNPYFILENEKSIKEWLHYYPDSIHFVLMDEYYAWPFTNLNQEAPYYRVTASLFKELTALASSTGLIAVIKKPAWDEAVSLEKANNVAILDGISIPSNMGAIARNAAAFNMDAVLFTSSCSDPYHPRAIRAMAGYCFKIPFIPCTENLLMKLKKNRFHFYFLDPRAADSIETLSFSEKNVFCFGSEGQGFRTDFIIKELSEMRKIRIPIHPEVDSLNVAVTSGIVFFMFNLLKKRVL